MASYKHVQLKDGSREVRLLTLDPGLDSDDIVIELHHDVLSETSPPSYEAVSYVWGSTKNHTPIEIKAPGGTKQTMLVTRNLFSALKHLRHEERPRTLWVDAVCIDQSNVTERNQQVAMMGDIFRSATRVLAWLGPEENDSTRAIEYLDELASYTSVQWVTHEIKVAETSRLRRLRTDDGSPYVLLSPSEFQAIYHVIMRPYFTRLWIIQELTLGGDRSVMVCGKALIKWDDFHLALFCVYMLGGIPLGHLRTPFINRCSMIQRLAQVGTYGRIHNLRSQLGLSQCSDPRDRIYGALNIIHDERELLGIYPDYSKTVTEVYRHTTIEWIKYYKELGILSSCQLPVSLPDLPTWVPDWSTPLGCRRLWRPDIDNLWADLVPLSFPADGMLRTFGVTCATIDEVYDLSGLDSDMTSEAFCGTLKDILSYTIRSPLRDRYINGESKAEAVCRTLVIDRFSDRYLPPRQAFLHYNEGSRVFELLDTDMAKAADSALYYKLSVFQDSPGKCFFITQEGYIGMAPSSAQPGDIVCNLIGNDKPMLLRPNANKSQTSYRLVGECYIHGLMAHEAIFGEFPKGYREVYCHDPGTDKDVIRYLNRETNTVEETDPRPRRHVINSLAEDSPQSFSDLEAESEYAVQLWKDSGVDIRQFDIV